LSKAEEGSSVEGKIVENSRADDTIKTLDKKSPDDGKLGNSQGIFGNYLQK